MNVRSWRIYRILLCVGLCTGLVRWTFASGLALGALTGAAVYKLDEHWVSRVLETTSPAGSFGHSLLVFGLMALALLAGALWPALFNIFAAAAGLLLIKLSLILDSLLERRKS
jgi:hypothetical protein